MSMPSPRPAPSPLVSWGIALAAGTMLLIGGGTIVWSSRAQDPSLVYPPTDQPGPTTAVATDLTVADADVVHRRQLPMPPAGLTLHSVAFTTENGTRVVKIRVVETGDELVVDAATGRLLEARPSRSTAPPPVGKFAAPFDPMT
jgi:hypothetical protein